MVNLNPYPQYPVPESRFGLVRDTVSLLFSRPGNWSDQQSRCKNIRANIDELVRNPSKQTVYKQETNNNVR